MPFKPHHAPLSNTYVLLSIFGMLLAYVIWPLSQTWGFLLLLCSIIMFVSSYISAMRAPLMNDDEIELAIHEKYRGRRYPDTDLHHGHIPGRKKYAHSRHKKILVKQALEGAAKTAKRKTTSKNARKKAAGKR
ncbi:hypothetical protein JXA12_04780 [Candidatus Woesearchaeota archaeon]|nr:hypothetical protein [Candidatus Woesearchaeota archaeon]